MYGSYSDNRAKKLNFIYFLQRCIITTVTLLWTVFRYGFLEEWPKANLWRISRPQSDRLGRDWSSLGLRKSVCEARQSNLPDLNDESLMGISKMWERFQVGIIPSPHYKEPGAYSDDFWSLIVSKIAGYGARREGTVSPGDLIHQS